MNPGEFYTLIGVIVTAGAGVGATILHLSSRLATVETIVSRELNPNGGESLKDRVTRIDITTRAHYDEHQFQGRLSTDDVTGSEF